MVTWELGCRFSWDTRLSFVVGSSIVVCRGKLGGRFLRVSQSVSARRHAVVSWVCRVKRWTTLSVPFFLSSGLSLWREACCSRGRRLPATLSVGRWVLLLVRGPGPRDGVILIDLFRECELVN